MFCLNRFFLFDMGTFILGGLTIVSQRKKRPDIVYLQKNCLNISDRTKKEKIIPVLHKAIPSTFMTCY